MTHLSSRFESWGSSPGATRREHWPELYEPAAHEQGLKKLPTLIAELSRAFEEITRKSADLRGN